MFKTLFVGLPGFEPGQTGPESVVLPLYYSPIHITKSKRNPPLERWLGYPDSNQDKQDQNLLYYPYTIAQCYVICNG